jgi:acyl-CoA reductase-like NAD-dependent aldehyde dehydrogenase
MYGLAIYMKWAHLIDGQRVYSDSTLEVVNPATGEVFARCPSANKQQLDSAVSAARAAFAQWRAKSFDERAGAIRKMAAVLREHHYRPLGVVGIITPRE